MGIFFLTVIITLYSLASMPRLCYRTVQGVLGLLEDLFSAPINSLMLVLLENGHILSHGDSQFLHLGFAVPLLEPSAFNSHV